MSRRRNYRLGKRADGVAETRRRITDAARALFLGGDFHEVSIDAVAARARVGRTTVFEQFGSKLGLLRAIEADVSARAGVEELLRRLDDPDPLRALRVAFEVGCGVWARERAMFRKLFSLAAIDPELRAVMAEKDAGRRKLVAELVRRLDRRRRLKVPLPAARELLGLLTSFQTFDTLHGERRSAAQVAALLLTLAGAFVRDGG